MAPWVPGLGHRWWMWHGGMEGGVDRLSLGGMLCAWHLRSLLWTYLQIRVPPTHQGISCRQCISWCLPRTVRMNVLERQMCSPLVTEDTPTIWVPWGNIFRNSPRTSGWSTPPCTPIPTTCRHGCTIVQPIVKGYPPGRTYKKRDGCSLTPKKKYFFYYFNRRIVSRDR